MINLKVWSLAVAASVCATAAMAQTPMFTVTTLASLSGATSETAYGINDQGTAAGIIAGGTTCPVMCVVTWSGGAAHVLDAPQSGTTFTSVSVAGQGSIVGTQQINGTFQAIAWYSGTLQLLPSPDSKHPATAAHGVNDSSYTAGSATNVAGNSVAVLWDVATPMVLDTPTGATAAVAEGINDNGLVVGYVCCNSSGAKEATVWHGTTPTLLAKSTGGSKAVAVNNTGIAVGTAGTSAAAWYNKLLYPLSTVASSAVSINGEGVIVGEVQSGTETHAAVWGNYKSAMQDLNSLISASAANQIVLTSAAGINNNCAIVANGYVKSTNAQKAFLLVLTNQANCVSGL